MQRRWRQRPARRCRLPRVRIAAPACPPLSALSPLQVAPAAQPALSAAPAARSAAVAAPPRRRLPHHRAGGGARGGSRGGRRRRQGPVGLLGDRQRHQAGECEAQPCRPSPLSPLLSLPARSFALGRSSLPARPPHPPPLRLAPCRWPSPLRTSRCCGTSAGM